MSVMRGPRGVRDAVAAYLRGSFPERLVELRDLWELDPEELPDPKEYLSHAPFALDQWPSISVSIARTAGVRRSEVTDDGGILWRTTYTLECFAWVNAGDKDNVSGWARVIDARDDLTTALRYHLLDRPHVNLGPLGTLMVQDSTLVEDVSDPVKAKGDRWTAGGMVSADVVVEETITRPAQGTVVSVSPVMLPPHPALG